MNPRNMLDEILEGGDAKNGGKTGDIAELVSKFKTGAFRGCAAAYERISRETAHNIIFSFKHRGYADLDPWQFDRITSILLGRDIHYDGVDYHLPSKYMRVYGHYLKSQEDGPAANHGEKRYRIIVADGDALKRDSYDPMFAKFYDWHKKNGVALHAITRPMIDAMLKKYDIAPVSCASGMGLWREEFAALFGGFEDGRIRTCIVEKGAREFDSITRAYNEIIENSREIISPGKYNEIPDELAGNWWDYVNPQKRWENIEPFVTNFMEKHREKGWILDAASGIGVEYYYMLKAGYMMAASEYQSELIQAGKRFFEREADGCEYEPHQKDWRAFDTLAYREKFVGVMLVGNSLRTLPDRGGQQTAIDVFYRMLRAGGTIMIDERNADKFMKKEPDVTRCEEHPADTETFASLERFASDPPNVMYHSQELKSIPYMVKPGTGEIGFRYYRRGEGVDSMSGVKKRRIHEWTFLHADKMEDMLERAGFKNTRKYGDYTVEKELRPYETADDACMFVYVAEKA